MAHSSSNDKSYRLIVEKMRFSEPRILILYLLFGDALYIGLSILGNRLYTMLTTDKLFYIVQIGIIYIAFVFKGFLNKIHEFLEIGEKTQGKSPLRNLFVSVEAFSEYKGKIIEKIFSKQQLYFSISFFIIFVSIAVFYDIKIAHLFGKPFKAESVDIWGILIFLLYYYLWWWIIGFAALSLVWALFWFIAGLIRIKDAKGLKIKESIESFKSLVNTKKFDDEALNRSLEGYYSYNRFIADSEKITELSLFIAVRVAIVAILYSIGWIGIVGIISHEWNLPLTALTIFIDVLAIVIFIIPPLSIHKILKTVKSEISNIINDIYERNKMRAVVRYASYSPVKENLISNITFLKNIAEETSSLTTWTIDLQAIIKLTAYIVPTVLPYLIQKLLS